ncbi:MAG: hypothetical protein ACPLIG_08705 [Candidatus Bathyarchaeales archaeon]
MLQLEISLLLTVASVVDKGIRVDSKEYQRISIFTALHDVMREKALNELRFAKCAGCGLYTPYKLKNVAKKTVRCKKCGSSIKV